MFGVEAFTFKAFANLAVGFVGVGIEVWSCLWLQTDLHFHQLPGDSSVVPFGLWPVFLLRMMIYCRKRSYMLESPGRGYKVMLQHAW